MVYLFKVVDFRPMDQDDVVRYAGDYPDMGIVTFDHKDPYESWSDRHHRRNWGEMVSLARILFVSFFSCPKKGAKF